MKTKLLLSSLLHISLILAVLVLSDGCGQRGADGRVYVSINWLFNPFYWSSNIPGIPAVITSGQYYLVSPPPAAGGSAYSYSYTAWDGSMWAGTLTITPNPGKDAGLFANGADGGIRYYDLFCYSTGSSVVVTGLQALSTASETAKAGLQNLVPLTQPVAAQSMRFIAPVAVNTASDSVFVQDMTDNAYSLHLEYRRIQ